MRRLKAIHLIPVCAVLLIGGAAAAYYYLFKPKLEEVDAAHASWASAQAELRTAESGYQQSLQDQVKHAEKLVSDYYQFREVQNRMPAIYNMKTLYSGREQEGLLRWYTIMGTGQMITELTTWARGFQLANTPTFTYSGTMGYEDTLPDVKIVKVDFARQRYEVRGYTNMLNAIRRTTGYSYFPLIIRPVDDTYTISVGSRTSYTHLPKSPALTMEYDATAYFFTRGWDPLGTPDTAQAELEKARQLILNPPVPKSQRSSFEDVSKGGGAGRPCPPFLWVMERHPDLEPN